jgi:murein hydrolase activator
MGYMVSRFTRIRETARVGIAFGAGILLASAALTGAALSQTIADERLALQQAKSQSVVAGQRADMLARRAAAASNEADRIASESASVAARIQSAEADITAAEARIRLIETMRAEQRSKLAAMQAPAVRLVAALQMMSRRPPAIALVQPGTTTDLVHVRAIIASMMPVMRKRTESLRGEIVRGRTLRADADRALTILDAGQQRLINERSKLVQIAARRRQASQVLTSSAMVEQDRAIALGEKARDIVDLIDRLGESSAVRARLEDLPGPILRPMRPGETRAAPVERGTAPGGLASYRLPVTGTVVTGMGEVSDSGVRARGLTIQTRPLAQVVSPTTGRVAFAGDYRGYGRIVIIDHGRQWTTLITNLSLLDVRVGDRLVQGSPIGKAGTGRPTITIELRRGNTPINITPIVS